MGKIMEARVNQSDSAGLCLEDMIPDLAPLDTPSMWMISARSSIATLLRGKSKHGVWVTATRVGRREGSATAAPFRLPILAGRTMAQRSPVSALRNPANIPARTPSALPMATPLWVTKGSPWIATRWMGSWMWLSWRSRRAQLATEAYLQSLLRLRHQDQ